MEAARRLARQFGAVLGRPTQGPMRDFGPSVLGSLVGLLHGRGGRVVFFVPPQSEVFLATYRTPLRLEDRRLFAEQARAWDAPLLDPDFSYDDRDLPDLWHLRPERAPEFTRAVADAWIAATTPAR
jgi:hypothetical protein